MRIGTLPDVNDSVDFRRLVALAESLGFLSEIWIPATQNECTVMRLGRLVAHRILGANQQARQTQTSHRHLIL